MPTLPLVSLATARVFRSHAKPVDLDSPQIYIAFCGAQEDDLILNKFGSTIFYTPDGRIEAYANEHDHDTVFASANDTEWQTY